VSNSSVESYMIIDNSQPLFVSVQFAIIDDYLADLSGMAIKAYLALKRFASFENKKCWPSLATIGAKVGASRPAISGAIKELEEKGLISVTRKQEHGKSYAVNVYTILPIIPRRGVQPVESLPDKGVQPAESPIQPAESPVNQAFHELDPINKNHKKENIRASDVVPTSDPPPAKPKRKPVEPSPDALRLSRLLLDLHRLRDSGFLADPKKAEHSVLGWAVDIDRLIRIDQRAPELVELVLRWAQADSFWGGQILSGSKFRDKFDALLDQSHRRASGGRPAPIIQDSGQRPGLTDAEKEANRAWAAKLLKDSGLEGR